MSSGRERATAADETRSRSTKAAVVGMALLAFLVWRGAASFALVTAEILFADVPEERRFAYLSEALTMTQDERIARGLALREQRRSVPVGVEWRLFSQLRELVPEDGQVHFLAPITPRTTSAFSDLQTLLYPRRFFRVTAIEPDLAPRPGSDARMFVVSFVATEELRPERWFDRVAAGDGYTVWRFREGSR